MLTELEESQDKEAWAGHQFLVVFWPAVAHGLGGQRLDQRFDQEARGGRGCAERRERLAPEAHVLRPGPQFPDVGLELDVEVRAALPLPVNEWMLGRHDQRATRPEHAEEFRERRGAVVGVMDGERADNGVEGGVRVRQWLAENGTVNPHRQLPRVVPGQFHHGRARVECRHDGTGR